MSSISCDELKFKLNDELTSDLVDLMVHLAKVPGIQQRTLEQTFLGYGRGWNKTEG